nr:hypothetical protein [Tanacetum cinerariifolium]
VRAFFALGYFKLHLVILADFADEVGYVDENVLASLVYFDEAEAFGFVEEFYGSCLHDAEDKRVIEQAAANLQKQLSKLNYLYLHKSIGL